MAAVLIRGSRVEVPEGWILVASGNTEPGDRIARTEFDRWKWFNIETGDLYQSADSFNAVIRRDLAATEGQK